MLVNKYKVQQHKRTVLLMSKKKTMSGKVLKILMIELWVGITIKVKLFMVEFLTSKVIMWSHLELGSLRLHWMIFCLMVALIKINRAVTSCLLELVHRKDHLV